MLEIFLSIGILILIMVCCFFSLKSNRKNKASYDEMQKDFRNSAYKNGFFTLLGFNAIFSVLEKFDITIFDSFTTTSFVGMLIALFIFAFICIKNDSYLAIKENKKLKISMFFIIGFVNLVSFIINVNSGLLFVNNLVTFEICYGLIAFIFLFLGIFLLYKDIQSKKED